MSVAKRSMRPFFISIHFGWAPAEQINPFSIPAPKAGVSSPHTTSEAPGVGSEQAGDNLAFAAVFQIHRHRRLGDLSRA